ncbi:MAG TPA: hypothetical protein ENI94_11895 [Gammaproteobacteria bacterium]|nr:hypothetical protein [Gammaproteobacteria bacterium]
MYIRSLITRSPPVSTLVSIFFLITGGTLVLPQVQAEQSFKPEAHEVFVQALADKAQQKNALVSVVYDLKQWEVNGQKPPRHQKLLIDKQAVTLRDDGYDGDKKSGDGIFSAFIEFDFDALVLRHRRIQELENKLGKEAMPSRFENRQLVGRVEIMSSNSLFPVITPFFPEEELQNELSREIFSGEQLALATNMSIMTGDKLSAAIELGKPIPLFPFGIAAAIDDEKSLLIRHPAVVQDPSRTFNVCTGMGNPDGVWTFKHLVTEMANTAQTGVTPEEFVRMWLSQWETSQIVNNWTVEGRTADIRTKIIDPWEAASGGPENPLDLDKAPVQLMAIVNRVDLRENLAYGGGSAGEGRFVFRVMDQGCHAWPFTIIFEYGIEKKSCSAVKSWGQSWADLSGMALGSVAYNAALEDITESFVQANAAPAKPNGSALNQLRTNENFLNNPWELREFVIAGAGWNQHFLKPNAVALTPDTSLNNTPILNSYFASGIGGVPLRFPTIADPFRGGASTVPSSGFFWKAPGIPSTLAEAETRQKFSLETCNGCHAGETGTSFTHIKPGHPHEDLPANLSGFMTGIDVTDPAPPPGITIIRHFNDLERRSSDLDGLVNSSCLALLAKPALEAPH